MNTLECIKTRHSTRKFKADQLSRELIDQVLDAGRRAPSGGNTQLTHFIVITNQDVLNELVTLVQEEYGKMPITENTLPYMVNFNYSSNTHLRAAFTRTISGASTAISLPTPPMAIPTSDFLKAGASFMYLDNQMDF